MKLKPLCMPVLFVLEAHAKKQQIHLECITLALFVVISCFEMVYETNTLTSVPLQVTQLTGFSDPVYAEAYVHVNQYDIVLDVLVVNQTSDTLQNCTLELATLGKEYWWKQSNCLATVSCWVLTPCFK